MTVPFKVIIPARYASTRFPGKALADIGGKPMVQHVYERAIASGAGQVILATDDERIRRAGEEFGAEVCMTGREHASGSDRLAEVVSRYKWPAATIIVNVQGDEPLIPPENIAQVAANIAAHPQAAMATLVTGFADRNELISTDNVKVVIDCNGYAIYFSRAVIPHDRDGNMDIKYQRHIGIYAYHAQSLLEFAALEPAPPELQEKLEQLRALWYGRKIHVAHAVKNPPPGVDTPEDLRRLMDLPEKDAC